MKNLIVLLATVMVFGVGNALAQDVRIGNDFDFENAYQNHFDSLVDDKKDDVMFHKSIFETVMSIDVFGNIKTHRKRVKLQNWALLSVMTYLPVMILPFPGSEEVKPFVLETPKTCAGPKGPMH